VKLQDDPAVERLAAAPTELGYRVRHATSSGLGATAMRPLSDPGAPGRVAPFAAVAIVVLMLVLLPPTSPSWPLLAAAAVVTTAVIAAALFVPWIRLPPWCQASIPLSFFAVVALVRQAEGGATSGYSPLVMLPILWIAVYGSRTQLRLASAATAATFLTPLILVGPPLYPSAGWRGSVLWVAIGLLAGTAAQKLVDQSRQRTADVAALGAVTRALTAGSDPRPQLCAAAQLVTGAAFAVLFEPRDDGTLVATAGTEGLDLGLMPIDPRTEVSATAEAWRTGARIYIADAADPRASARLSEHTGSSAVLFQPVTRDGRMTAVLVAGFREPHVRVSEVALDMVELVAAEISAALDRADLVALLAAQARTDELTGLPNRRALYVEGQARLVEPQRRRMALLMLDLDKFKEVNDSLGHHAGDLLLIQVGARLSEQLRAGDVLARLGGDEFAVLLEDAGRDQASEVAVKLRSALAEPFALADITLHGSVSIGIALFPDDGPDLSSLLRKADIAMYKAKASGDGHHIYCGSDDADDAARLRTVAELRTALTEDQLVVHYQPKIDLDTGEVHSVEALVRWDHPTRGLLYPDAFLTLVEESGLMPTLTRIVLSLALDQAATWQAHGQRLTVAVNLSASSLVDADLPEQVTAMLAARDLPPHVLQLEITEEFLMADRDRARAILTRLRHSGVHISIDDFGTGYSSLSYLRDLPIDELKLDRSFIFPMADDARAAALVASTISLAHSLGLRMVAEGVETAVAYAELTRLGCDQAQGYFMSRPVPAAEVDHWLSARRPANNLTELPQQRPRRPSGGH
jgi:diguanylate cyclase (GGDEF)-like protein